MKVFLLTISVLISTGCFAQGEITVKHAFQTEDFIEIGLSMEKTINKFELIDIDTMSVLDHKGIKLWFDDGVFILITISIKPIIQ